MKTILLIIEPSKGGHLWGRIDYEKNLLVDSAKTEGSLLKKMRGLLSDFHELNIYDVQLSIIYQKPGNDQIGTNRNSTGKGKKPD